MRLSWSQNRHRMNLPWWCILCFCYKYRPWLQMRKLHVCVEMIMQVEEEIWKVVPSRLCCLHHPVPPFASSGMHRHARRRESLTHHHERTCREKQVCPTGSRSSCVSALSNTLLHFASRPRRRLGTYLYIMMPALPQDIASLLTSGARCWQCSLHVT